MKKEQLIQENEKLRQRAARLKASLARQKKALLQTTQERDLVRRYFDFAGSIMVVFGSDGTVMLINDAGARALGRRKRDIIGRLWLDHFIPERFREEAKKVFAQLVAGRIRHTEYFENPILDAAGEEKIIAWHNTILRDEQGAIFATLSSGEDVTAHKQMVDQLKGNEERFRTIVENINAGIYRIGIFKNKNGLYGRFIQANESLAQMLGYDSLKELMAASIADHYRDHQDRQRFIADIIRTGFVRGRELGLLKKNGTGIWASITGKAYYDGRGAITWIDGIIEDVSERKQLEEKLRALSLMDELTGIYNRRGFFTLAGQQLKIAERTGKQQLLLFADMDDLKMINDSFGHVRGDEALRAAAAMLKDTYRTSDIIARIGGDEFALLAVDAAESDAALLRERMYEAIGSYNARTGCEYSISISLGIACFDPQRPRTIDELLSEADRLMYRQKKEMRGKKS